MLAHGFPGDVLSMRLSEPLTWPRGPITAATSGTPRGGEFNTLTWLSDVWLHSIVLYKSNFLNEVI